MSATSRTLAVERRSDREVFRIGQRVQIHPGLDRWMMGDRYGAIVHLYRGGKVARLVMDRSGASYRCLVENLSAI